MEESGLQSGRGRSRDDTGVHRASGMGVTSVKHRAPGASCSDFVSLFSCLTLGALSRHTVLSPSELCGE